MELISNIVTMMVKTFEIKQTEWKIMSEREREKSSWCLYVMEAKRMGWVANRFISDRGTIIFSRSHARCEWRTGCLFGRFDVGMLEVIFHRHKVFFSTFMMICLWSFKNCNSALTMWHINYKYVIITVTLLYLTVSNMTCHHDNFLINVDILKLLVANITMFF